MRFTHLYFIFIFLLLLNFSSTTASASILSSSLSFALAHSRSILITAIRTQAVSALFKGLDETKECLQNRAKQSEKQDVSACFVGPLRALSAVYLVNADLRKWFFGNLEQKGGIKKGIRVLGGAIAARWLLKGEVGDMIWREVNTIGKSKWYMWTMRQWKRPAGLDKWRRKVKNMWIGVRTMFWKVLRESETREAREKAERTIGKVGKRVRGIVVNGMDILHGVWGDSSATLKRTGEWMTNKVREYLV